jgi:hypothetical protein
VERKRTGKSDEPVRMPSDQLRHLIIGESGELSCDCRRPELLDRRHGEYQDLCVIAQALYPPPPHVEIGQRSIEVEHALSVIAKLLARNCAFQMSLEPLQVTPGQDVANASTLRIEGAFILSTDGLGEGRHLPPSYSNTHGKGCQEVILSDTQRTQTGISERAAAIC